MDDRRFELPDGGLARFERWFRGLSSTAQWAFYAAFLLGLEYGLLDEGPARGAYVVTIVLLVASVILSELLRPKPNFENARPATLADFDIPTATEGRVVPLLWGRVLIKGPNVVWYGDLDQEKIRETVRTGLWSKESFTKGFNYRLGIQFGICRGPGAVIKRVRIGEKDAWTGSVSGPEGRFDIDEPELLGGEDFGSGGIQATCDFYSGEPDQPVNAYLNDDDRQRISTAATPTAPRYTGTCYVVARELTSAAPTAADRGAYIGDSTSLKPWAFEVERIPALFSGQTAGENAIGSDGDANPINVIYELLTNSEWGFGHAASSIDVGASSTFVKASDNMIAEANGFSMLLDREVSARELLVELERQIDGVVYLDQRTGKWSIQLARGPDDTNFGYDINTVPELSDANVAEINEFARGSWDDTTNQIVVEYAKRSDDYKLSYAPAQDLGNAIIRGGGSVLTPKVTPGQVRMPGVKDPALASSIAWRELRLQSYPLARVKLVTTREIWDVKVASVVAWTNARRGFTKLPMRVMAIDYGTLNSGKMTVTLVQDVFTFAAASSGTPPPSGWTPPTTTLVAYPSDEQLAFECPRAILVRDPDYLGDSTVAKVWAAVRRQTTEVAFEIWQRNSSGTPAGAFAQAGTVTGFMRIGSLAADLAAGTAIPTSSIVIAPSPDSQTALEALFDDTSTLQDLGVGLEHLILIGSEFMLVRSASDSGANVALANVYRGALDSAQAAHSSGADVYLLFAGGGLTTTTFPTTNNVDVELRMRSAQSLFSGSVTRISFAFARRALRPYPPSAVIYNGSGSIYGTPALEGDGSGLNGVGFDIEWRRRRYDNADEVSELLADQAVDGSTEYRVRVYVDPTGSNDLAFDSGWTTGAGPVTPTQAELVTFAAAGTDIRVQISTRHDVGTVTNLEASQDLVHDVTPTSPRSAQFYLGGDLRASDVSNAYTVASAGVHNVTIGAAYSTSTVQVRINGGSWTTIIAAGNTTGATASLSISDTIELRHTANETPDPQFVEIDDGTSAVAYGAFSA